MVITIFPKAKIAKERAVQAKIAIELEEIRRTQIAKAELERKRKEEEEIAEKAKAHKKLVKEQSERIVMEAINYAAVGLYIMPLGKVNRDTYSKIYKLGFSISSPREMIDKVHAGVYKQLKINLDIEEAFASDSLFSELANHLYLMLVDSHMLVMSDWEIRNLQQKILKSFQSDLDADRLDKVINDLDRLRNEVRDGFYLANTNSIKNHEIKARFLNTLSSLIKEIEAEKKSAIRLYADKLQVTLPKQISKFWESRRLIGWWEIPVSENKRSNHVASALNLLASNYGRKILLNIKKEITSSARLGLQCTEVLLNNRSCYVKFNDLIRKFLVHHGYKVSKEKIDSDMLKLKIEFM